VIRLKSDPPATSARPTRLDWTRLEAGWRLAGWTAATNCQGAFYWSQEIDAITNGFLHRPHTPLTDRRADWTDAVAPCNSHRLRPTTEQTMVR